MFEKTKQKVTEFYKKHEVAILTVGGAVLTVGGVVAVINMTNKNKSETEMDYDTFSNTLDAIANDNADRKILESYGAVYEEGYQVPFITKEGAQKFMEERGNCYQIDILDDLTSVVWISPGEEVKTTE